MKVVRQARLELSGVSTPDLLRPPLCAFVGFNHIPTDPPIHPYPPPKAREVPGLPYRPAQQVHTSRAMTKSFCAQQGHNQKPFNSRIICRPTEWGFQ